VFINIINSWISNYSFEHIAKIIFDFIIYERIKEKEGLELVKQDAEINQILYVVDE
jgi:hypothetical protein